MIRLFQRTLGRQMGHHTGSRGSDSERTSQVVRKFLSMKGVPLDYKLDILLEEKLEGKRLILAKYALRENTNDPDILCEAEHHRMVRLLAISKEILSTTCPSRLAHLRKIAGSEELLITSKDL